MNNPPDTVKRSALSGRDGDEDMSEQIPRAVAGQPRAGHWTLCVIDQLGDHPRYSALIFCLLCGRALSLINHTIAVDGHVTPSVGHPDAYRRADGSMCPWHPTPRLLDWPTDLPSISPIAKSRCEKCGRESRSIGGWGLIVGQLQCDQCFNETLKGPRMSEHPPVTEEMVPQKLALRLSPLNARRGQRVCPPATPPAPQADRGQEVPRLVRPTSRTTCMAWQSRGVRCRGCWTMGLRSKSTAWRPAARRLLFHASGACCRPRRAMGYRRTS